MEPTAVRFDAKGEYRIPPVPKPDDVEGQKVVRLVTIVESDRLGLGAIDRFHPILHQREKDQIRRYDRDVGVLTEESVQRYRIAEGIGYNVW